LHNDLNAIHNRCEHECLHKVVRLLNINPICQSNAHKFRSNHCSIPALHGIQSLVHQPWAIFFIVRRWVWKSDLLEALMANEMGHGKTFTLVSAAQIGQLLAEKVYIDLLHSIMWGNILQEAVSVAQHYYPAIISEQWELHRQERMNSMPPRLLEIPISPLQAHPVLTKALRPIPVITMPGLTEPL